LERAVIQHRLDDDETTYVFEDGIFPFWISVDSHAGLICLRTHTNFKDSVSQTQRFEICNELNMSKFMITAYVRKERLWADYAINYRDGLLRETFIRVCRQFAKNVEGGLLNVDPEHDFLMRPGETETQDE